LMSYCTSIIQGFELFLLAYRKLAIISRDLKMSNFVKYYITVPQPGSDDSYASPK
jgi:hypothetical protein